MDEEQVDTRSRSAKGCWTCRIRHRKCDEKIPKCDECSKRAIKCHGYGERPQWMDGGSREREERASIKRAVKHNWTLARSKRIASRNGTLEANGDGMSTKTSGLIPQETILQDPTRTLLSSSPSQNGQQNLNSHFQNLNSADDLLQEDHISESEFHITRPSYMAADLTFEEADLIMHYLDHVFPLQFPYFTSSPKKSRGWLFWLLMKNRPLHQAVLSLSALHRYAIYPTMNYQRQDELNVRHVRAIQEVQRFLGESIGRGLLSPQELVELLACGTSLISFEVFRGGTGDWQPHLQGVSSALQSVPWTQNENTQIDEENPSCPKSIEEPARPVWIENAFETLAAIVLWYEILSCISTGHAPKLPYKLWLGTNRLDISQVMGCQNWAMEEIGNIACLHFWKLAAIQSRTLSMQQLVKRGAEVESRLEKGLKHLDIVEQKEEAKSDICAVTRIYALAGLVQLNTILWGTRPEISEIRDAVARAVRAIGEIGERKLRIRALVWSLCIVGCMSEPCHQEFFEKLISDVLSQSPKADFGNLESTLQIMRKCWEKQPMYQMEGYGWENAMRDLDICVLLI